MTNKMVKAKQNLPATAEELHEFILIGKEKINAQKAKIRAISKVEKAHHAKDAALQDAQDMATIVLYAEQKFGEVLKEIETSHGGSIEGKKGGSKKTLPPNVTHKESHQAQMLANNPDIVERVIAEAIEKEEIPTSWDVMKSVYKLQKKDASEQPVKVPGTYKTVVIDPPWEQNKIVRKVRPYQEHNLDYPSMSLDAIKESKFPFADECHVYLWTTQKYLPQAFNILYGWGIQYIQTLIWCKNVGFTPTDLFMNNAEFVLFGRSGALPLLKAGEKVVFGGKVREHSRKPDEFYDLIRKVSPEPRIDCFSREKRDGFDQWGNETEKF